MKDEICGCGKKLVPCYLKDKRIGVTHETTEDDEYHMEFWGGLRGRIKKPKKAD